MFYIRFNFTVVVQRTFTKPMKYIWHLTGSATEQHYIQEVQIQVQWHKWCCNYVQ